MKVEIYGQTYNLASEGDDPHLQEVAEFVDSRMRATAEAARTVDSVRVAVLASLNIADEMLTLRQRVDELEGQLRERVERCVHLVERALEQSA